jgi:hydrogenase nickel incorporation protein HypA/HybF
MVVPEAAVCGETFREGPLMHELSIAESVAAIVRRNAGGRSVQRVELKVGHLRQVVPSALEFAWALVTDGTELDGAALSLEEVPAAGMCRDCGTESPQPDFPFRCPDCAGLDIEVTAGEELLVDALEVEDRFEDVASTRGRSA